MWLLDVLDPAVCIAERRKIRFIFRKVLLSSVGQVDKQRGAGRLADFQKEECGNARAGNTTNDMPTCLPSKVRKCVRPAKPKKAKPACVVYSAAGHRPPTMARVRKFIIRVQYYFSHSSLLWHLPLPVLPILLLMLNTNHPSERSEGMSTRNVHKLVLPDTSRHNSSDEDEPPSSMKKSQHDESDKLGHTQRQMRLRWIISCFHSPPILQRLLVLRKYYVVLLAMSAIVSLYAVQKQVQKSSRRSRLPPWPLPSVALQRMLPTAPLDRPKPSFDSESGWPRVSYFAELPSVDDPLWPPLPLEKKADDSDQSSASRPTTTISTCVPGLAKDIYDESRVSSFLLSNQRQEVPAKELIFLFSDVNAVIAENDDNGLIMTGEQWCQDAHKILKDFHTNLIIVCLGERITAGRARNVLSRVATSDVLAFIDTDDEEEPERNKVIQQVFDCHPGLKLLLHSNYGTGHGFYGKVRYHPYDSLPEPTETTSVLACPDEQEGVEVIRGIALREMLDQSQDVLKFGIRTVGGMRPGHLVVKRDVTRYVRSSSIYKGQDTLWARDIIYMYGRRDETAMFLNRPLTTYYQSSHSFNVNVKSRHNKA